MKIRIRPNSIDELAADKQLFMDILLSYVDRDLKFEQQQALMKQICEQLSCVVVEDDEGEDMRVYSTIGKLIRLFSSERMFNLVKKPKMVGGQRFYILRIESRYQLIKFLNEQRKV